jgi:hypothetical protein
MIKRLSLILLLLGILIIAAPPVRAQQEAITPTIIHIATEPQGDHLHVTVYFSLRDSRGRPVLRDGASGVALDKSGTIKLLLPAGPDAPALVDAPQTPLNLLLLVDTSGSMAAQVKAANGPPHTVIDDVKQAAIKALDSAPAGSNLAVARFDDLDPDKPLSLMQALTPDGAKAAGAISAIPKPAAKAPTCMFNAAYQGVEYLHSAVTHAEERRAVLLFTDGKDERSDGSSCSTRQPNDVIANARDNSTAIYTIGLCADQNCTNVDRATLQRLADETAAVSATGDITHVSDLFGQIMDELNSQWAIQADIYPRQGDNAGLLQVTAADNRLFSKEFKFTSDRDYNAPPTLQMQPAYDAENDRFTLQIGITNSENLDQATLEIWDKNGGVLLRSQPIGGPGTVEVATTGMLATREYLLRVRAVAKGGAVIAGADKSPYAIEQTVTYDPRLAFSISGASADWKNNRLMLDVRVRGAGGIAPIFDGQITNERGEVLIPISHAALSDAGRIELAIPDSLQKARGEQKLKAHLTLASRAAPVEGELGFSVVPPDQPFPWAQWLLGATALALGLYALVRLTKPRQSTVDTATPPPMRVSHSNPSGEINIAPGEPRLRIRVVSSPDRSEVRAEVITHFPCVVGASSGAGFVVRGASTASRMHLQITHSPQTGFEITDVSRHGTYRVEGTQLVQLKPRTPIVVRGPVQLSLAKEIVLDLEPL